MRDNFKKSFVVPFLAFWLVSFMIFAPTANILFALPPAAKAAEAEPTTGPVAYGIAFSACAAAKAVGTAIGSSFGGTEMAYGVPIGILSIPSAEYGGLFTQLDQCATMLSQNKVIKWIDDAVIWAAQLVLNKLLQDMTNQVIKCINSYDEKTGKCDTGKKGFVVNFNQLFQDAVQTAGARFLNSLTGVNLCSITPRLKLQVLLLPVPEFKEQAACTLNKIVDNIEDFYADFRKGGWLAWKESLKPNNNAFGAWLTALDEKTAKEFLDMNKKSKETTNGFKPVKKCLSAGGKTNYEANKGNCDAWKAALANEDVFLEDKFEIEEQYNAQCTGNIDASSLSPDAPDCAMAVTTTPSGSMEFMTNFSAVSPIRQLEDKMNAAIYSKMGPYGVYMSAIANAFLNKLVDTGLQKVIGAITEEDVSSADPYAKIKEEAGITATTGKPITVAGETVEAKTVSGETLQIKLADGSVKSATTTSEETITVIIKEVLPATQETILKNITLIKGKVNPGQTLKVKVSGAVVTGETVEGDIIKVAIKQINPYQNEINTTATNAQNQYISTGDIDTNYLDLIKKSLQSVSGILGDSATKDTSLNIYATLLLLTNGKTDNIDLGGDAGVRDFQNKIIDEFWSQGTKDQSTTEKLDSTPTITYPSSALSKSNPCSADSLITEKKSTLLYINTRIGKATIEKTERFYRKCIFDSGTGAGDYNIGYIGGGSYDYTTIVYTSIDKQDQIENIDGEVTKFNTKYSALYTVKTYTDAAISAIDVALAKIAAIPDPSDLDYETARAAARTAVIDAINAIQKVLPSTTTKKIADMSTGEIANLTSDEITKALGTLNDETNNYSNLLSQELTYQNTQTYGDYLDDVKNTYNQMYEDAHPWP